MKTNQKSNSKEKIVEEYQNKISDYLRKNNQLELEISDLEKSIEINQNIIFSYLPNNDEVNKLKDDLFETISKYLSLIDEKSKCESQLIKLSQMINNLPEEIKMLKQINEELKNELNEKIGQIYKLEKDIDKQRKSQIFKEALKEIYVMSPTKNNLELFNKVIKTQDDIDKLNDDRGDKRKCKMLEVAVKCLEEQLNQINKDNKNEKENKDILKTNSKEYDNIFSKEEEYSESENSNKEEEEKSSNEDEEENNSFSDDDLTLIESNNDPEIIKKEIENYKKDIKKLENENKNYKDQVEKYKNDYKDLREEIHKLLKYIKKSSSSTQDTASTSVINSSNTKSSKTEKK